MRSHELDILQHSTFAHKRIGPHLSLREEEIDRA